MASREGSLVCVEPIPTPGKDGTEVFVTSFATTTVTLTLQWRGAGSRDRRETRKLKSGESVDVTVAGWLGRDCDWISVPEIVAKAGDEVETWRADKEMVYTCMAAPRGPATPARVVVTRECRQRRLKELQERQRAREVELALIEQKKKRKQQAARAARMDAVEAALAPYRPPKAGGDERWEQLRGVALPDLSAKWIEEGDFYGMPEQLSYSGAWLAPMPAGGVVCVYKVTSELFDKYGSDMTPGPETRWEARPVLVSTASGASWNGPAKVLHLKGRHDH